MRRWTGHTPLALALVLPAAVVERPATPAPAPLLTTQTETPLHLHLDAPADADGKRAVETAGLVTALTDLGLAELRGVVPHIGDRPLSPGLSESVGQNGAPWTGAIAVDNDVFSLTLCEPTGDCHRHLAALDINNPELAVARVVLSASVQLDRPLVGVLQTEPVSEDDYAVTMTGRSAAVGYGLRSAVSPDRLGDKRRDPVARAVYLDPDISLGWREVGRQASSEVKAWTAMAQAADAAPESIVALADQAAALEAVGRCEASWLGWTMVDERSPEDPRFVVQRARAALCAGDLGAAETLLTSLSDDFKGDAQIARMWVALADARGPGEDYDALLADWQASDDAAEPVRRRIQLRVARGAYEEALSLVGVLADRGAASEASELKLALLANLSDWVGAAVEARQLGLTEAARRIDARSGAEVADAESLAVAPADPLLRLSEAEQLIDDGHHEAAVSLVDWVLAHNPWLPEGLLIKERALLKLGRRGEARTVREALERLDPALARRNG